MNFRPEPELDQKSRIRLTTLNELVYLVIGLVTLVVNYFVSFMASTVVDHAFLVGFYLLQFKKILFQMAKRKCSFTNKMLKKHPCFRKGGIDYEAE